MILLEATLLECFIIDLCSCVFQGVCERPNFGALPPLFKSQGVESDFKEVFIVLLFVTSLLLLF